MKKLVLGLLLGIFLINLVIALDCQYKENHPYQKDVIVFYENGTKLDYNLLEMQDLKQGSPGNSYGAGFTQMEFNVYNNYNLEVNVTIDYIFNGQLQSVNTAIASKGHYLVTGPATPGLDENSINFYIRTTGLEAKREPTRFDNYSCTQCPDGSNFTCLNDGQNCTDFSQCGGAHCVHGYCSHSSSCFNNDCKCAPDEIQCGDNTQCVKKNSVQLGFKPICRYEECVTGYLNKNGACALKNGENCLIPDDCASGICNPNHECGPFDGCTGNTNYCNVTDKCVTPSTKKAGEAYSCKFECKSLRGADGICLRSIVWWVCFWVICIIITSAGVWAFAVWNREKAKKERLEAEKGRDEAKSEIDKHRKSLLDLKEENENINKKIRDAQLRYDKNDKELSERLEKAEVLAKEEVEKEIQDERKRREKELNSLKELKESTEKSITRTKELMTYPFLNNQRYKVLLNEYGYEICSWDKTKSFHVWWYEKNSGETVNPGLFEVHHIDGDKRNNDYFNLIKLDKDTHRKIHHFEKKWLSRKKGIELLKKYNIDVTTRVNEQKKLD